MILSCIDPYKPIHSVDYSVTDTFRAQNDEKILIPPNIFKDNALIAKNILGLKDSRWDFSQGWFELLEDKEVLVRLNGQGWIENEWVVASISNLHSQRFGTGIVVNDLLSRDTFSRIDQIYSKFHDQNKDLLKRLLVDELLSRMGLKELGTNV